MSSLRGRRIAARSRFRSGNLMAEGDDTLADDVTPVTPPTEPGNRGKGGLGISIGIGIRL